jgi:predicted type IV restriction endonuclease
VERYLVDNLRFAKTEIQVDVPIEAEIDGDVYRSAADLAVQIGSRYMIVIICAAGSLGSREREVLALARLLVAYQIPWAIVSDGATALVFDTLTGAKRGEGLTAIPTRQELVDNAHRLTLRPLSTDRRKREQLIFRSYDSMNVNRVRGDGRQ